MTIQFDSRQTSEMLTNGSQNVFSFDFPVFKGDNYQKGIEVRFVTDLDFTVVDPSKFLVIPNTENSGGIVQFTQPPEAGKRLVIVGNTPVDQQLDITNFSRFSAQSIETNFDKIVAILQELYLALSEERRQRINNDEQLRIDIENLFDKLKIELKNQIDLLDDDMRQGYVEFENRMNKLFNEKWIDISDYLNSILPMIFCMMKKEALALYDPVLNEKFNEISEYLNSILPMFFCIMRKEITNYTETELVEVIREIINDFDVIPDKKIQTWSGRTQEDKNKDLVSVQDFGAVGVVPSDDTQAFTNIESLYQNRLIDLQGKTYKVTRDFNKNKYINGTLRIGSSNRGKGIISSAGFNFKSQIGNGQKVGELTSPLYDDVVPTASTIYQTVAYESAQNRIYTHRVLRGSAETEEIVVDCFDYLAMTVVGSTPLFTTSPTNYIGHQGFGVTRRNGVTNLWSTCGAIRYAERARFISRCKIDTSTGEFTEQLSYKVFGDEYTGSNTSVMSVSPNQQFLVCTATHPKNGRMCRVFNLDIFTGDDGADYSDQYLYEFGFGTISGIGPQSVCTDGNFIYFLHGSGTVKYTNIEVFTMDGAYVGTDINNTTALYDAQQMVYTYYEPECLFVGDSGRLMQCTAVAKKAGVNARGSYTNYIHILDLHETKVWRTDGGRPLVSMHANRCISHPSSKPITVSELTADGTYNDYRSESSSGYTVSVSKRHTDTTETSTTDSVQKILTNSNISGSLIASQSGYFGFYIPSKSLYPFAYNVNTNQCVIQFTTSIAGSFLPSANNARDIGSETLGFKKIWSNNLNLKNIKVYQDNSSAISGGLVAGDVYRTSSGVLMIVF